MLSYLPVEKVDGVELVTVLSDEMVIAMVTKTSVGYQVHRNHVATDPLPREEVVPFLKALAHYITMGEQDQQAAEAQGFDAISVTDLLDAEFGEGGWLL